MDDLLIQPMVKTEAQAVAELAGELGIRARQRRLAMEMVSQTDLLLRLPKQS